MKNLVFYFSILQKPHKEFRQKTELEKLIMYGFQKEVADKIDGFTRSGIPILLWIFFYLQSPELTSKPVISGILMPGALDKGARRALKALPLPDALAALEKFEHTAGEVSNKSHHLCIIISK